jgi:glycosyltransferase involved in cell wall biosynthesis
VISACILTRDDGATLEDCLKSIRPHVDEIVCVDTGSIDDSPQIAKRYADKFAVFLDCNEPATELISDFAMARNYAKDLASYPAHWWNDADDLVIGAEHLRSLAESMPEHGLMLVAYDYMRDGAGNVTCVHWRESLVKPRDKWKWSIPVHEVLLPQAIPAPEAQTTNLVRRVHRKELSKRAPDPERNLRILKKYVGQVGEGDVRAWYYLGVEYSMRGDIGNALRVLKRYVELTGWSDEKCLALLEIARIYQRTGDLSVAIEWAQRAMLTKSWPEPYWTITECFYSLAAAGVDDVYNARRAMHFAELGLSMPATETVLFVNPMKRFETLALLHQLYARFGMIERALEACHAALKGFPDDQSLKIRALQYERDISAQLQTVGAFDPGQWGTVQQLVSTALGIAPTAPALPAATVAPAAQPVGEGCLDLVFFLGPGYEPWNPVTMAQTGMGGSETMAWELAKRLRAIGHRVRMFSHCTPEHEGVFEGVEYLDSSRYGGIECDVLISSRRADREVADAAKARLRLLYVHDVHVGAALTPAAALRWDRILCLSEWHKAYMLAVYAEGVPALIAALRPEQIRVTRNGIAVERFSAQPERNPRRIVYSSSPDRGLKTLLEMWPAILAQEPEAELQIAYGWGNWEKSVEIGMRVDIPHMSPTALRQIKHMVRSLPRVTALGRIDQGKLAELMLSSGVWAYPTWYSETSCITAMEAQAAGLYCVTVPVGALPETVGSNGALVPGNWETEPTDSDRAAFVAAVVDALRGNVSREEIAAVARERFSLDTLAVDWDAMIREELAAVEERVVPEWKGAA